MIQKLNIRNYAIIEELEIRFSDQLTIITGETGAGKSILLGALGLIMGKRADTKSLYDDSRKCIVEGSFDIKKYRLKKFFDAHDIDYEDETTIRREITPSGKSRAFINDTPANLKVLQQLSAALIDLHQQFDTRDINNVSFQMRMIDALADNTDLLDKYSQEYRQYQKNRRMLKELNDQSSQAAREMDFLNFQMKEFNEAELMPDEQETLEQEQSRLTHAEDIKRKLGSAFQNLNEGDNSIIDQLEAIAFSVASVQEYHPKLAELYERYSSLVTEMQDLTGEFESIAEDTEYDEERIQEVQNRLDLIYRLQKKHHVNSVDELLTIQDDIKTKLTTFTDLSGNIERLEKEIGRQETSLQKQAAVLSKRRKTVIPGFEKKVHQMLGQLSMEHARLKVDCRPLEQVNATGMDEVEFLFAPNKGSRFLPIKSVASGGEMSRLTLCTKSLVASAIPLPTLIFDEIDTGVSGDVALKMGKILHDLARQHQVVSITHTPQIAVKAHAHYFVYKQVKDQRTVTSVKQLDEQERIQEVATMLSGSPPSNSAIENARELLSS